MERFSLFKNKIKKMDSRRRERIGDSYWNPTAITNPNLCVFQLYQVMELNISFTWNSLWVAIFTNRLYPDKLGTPSTNPSRPFWPLTGSFQIRRTEFHQGGSRTANLLPSRNCRETTVQGHVRLEPEITYSLSNVLALHHLWGGTIHNRKLASLDCLLQVAHKTS